LAEVKAKREHRLGCAILIPIQQMSFLSDSRESASQRLLRLLTAPSGTRLKVERPARVLLES